MFIPESPRLLVLKGKIEEAKAALRSICGQISDVDSVVESELEGIQAVVTDEGQLQEGSEGLFQKKNWKALYVTLSLVIFQQATGQPSVLYYAQEILKKADLFSDSSGASGQSTSLVRIGIIPWLLFRWRSGTWSLETAHDNRGCIQSRITRTSTTAPLWSQCLFEADFMPDNLCDVGEWIDSSPGCFGRDYLAGQFLIFEHRRCMGRCVCTACIRWIVSGESLIYAVG